MELETVTYQEIIDGYSPTGDKYGLASFSLAEPRLSAFLANPNLTDKSAVMLKIMREDGVIIGRSMMFPSILKAGDKLINTVGGSALEVAEEYRGGEAVGGLMMYNIKHKENNAVISSGFSAIAAKCHKALRAYMLYFPQMIQVKNFRKVLPLMVTNQFLSSILGAIGNFFIWPFLNIVKARSSRKYHSYQVKQVNIVPEWVDEIVLNDGHKFTEVHDHKWLQWNLDNMFHAHRFNNTRFYTVSLGDENLGFFMVKERYTVNEGKNRTEMVEGTICEWGTKNPSILSEFDLHLMALKTFSKNVDVVFMATNDMNIVKRMKHLFFVRKNEAKIAFYDLKKEYKDAKDINLWRVRIGYGDSILS